MVVDRKGLKNTKVRIAAIGAGLTIGATVITGAASASADTQDPDPDKTRFQGAVACMISQGENTLSPVNGLRGEIRDTESEAQNDLPALEEECSTQSGEVLSSRVLRIEPQPDE
jgi:hypothetical protein